MWDFSKPYRTEIWYNEVKDTPLNTPLCIPSYNRPNAPVFNSKICKSLEKDNLFVFIRDTKEQYDLYKNLENLCTLVPLPAYVKELGLTREAILQWGIAHKYNNLAMVDDRAKNLSTLVPALTRNGKLCLKPAPWSTPLITLKIWEKMQEIYNTTVSYGVFQENSWYPDNIDIQPTVSGFTEAVCVNLNDCKQFDLHYKSVYEYGIEDYRFIWQTLVKGLPAFQFTDIAYKEIPPEKMVQNTGSGAANIDKYSTVVSRKERIEKILEIFVEKSLGKKWGDKLDGFRYTTLKDGQEELKFVWNRYWKPYYEQHKVK